MAANGNRYAGLARRDAPVCCPSCGRTVRRKARKQLYCSTRCRKRAHYRKSVAEGKFNDPRYLGSGRGTMPPKTASKNNDLQPQKSGSSKFAKAPLDVLGGRWHWPGTPCLDQTKREAIIAVEIGGGSP